MQISDDRQICSLPAVDVRRLLRRANFSTLELMRVADRGEPDASEMLIDLEAEGWIQQSERRDRIDWWCPTEKGNRLVATRFIPRFPLSVGREIVEKLIAKARELNMDPERSHRVAALYLFGSVLDGSADGKVGDVDIVVETSRRQLDESNLRALEEAERRSCPNIGWFASLFLPQTLLKRSLRSVSQRVSLHPASDLALPGLRYRPIYTFDVAREIELPVDPAFRLTAGSTRKQIPRSAEISRVVPRHQFRDWPSPRAQHRRVTMSGDAGRLAEHLWQNGASMPEIAVRSNCSRETIRDYLSSRNGHVLHVPSFDAALDFMLYRAMPTSRAFCAAVTVTDCSVEIDLLDSASLRTLGRAVRSTRYGLEFIDMPAALIPIVENIARAGECWRKRMRARNGGIWFSAATMVTPASTPKSAGPIAMSVRGVAPTLRKMLNQSAGDRHPVYPGAILTIDMSATKVTLTVQPPTARAGSHPLSKETSEAIRAALAPFFSKWHQRSGRVCYTIPCNDRLREMEGRAS